MLKWLWIGLVGSLVFSLFVTSLVGIRPRAVQIIDPSKFTSHKSMGEFIYRRLYQELNDNSIVILGSSPYVSGGEEIWSGLVAASKKYGTKIDSLLEYSSMPHLNLTLNEQLGMDRRSQTWGYEQILKEVKYALAHHQKILIHTSNDLSSHLVKDSLQKYLLDQTKVRPWTISVTQLPVQKDEESQIVQPCRSTYPLAPLNCAISSLALSTYKKKFRSDELVAAVEKLGGNDYVLFVHNPKIKNEK